MSYERRFKPIGAKTGLSDLSTPDAVSGDFLQFDGTDWTLISEIPDSSLSSNVPLLDSVNTFTTSPQVFSGGFPRVRLQETDGATDEEIWEAFIFNGTFGIRTRDDTDSTGSSAITASRTGTTVDEIELNATTLDFNGQIQAEDGTASAPAYSFGNDADTGMYLSGSNTLAVATFGTLRSFWNANGLRIENGGALYLEEIAAANADVAGRGQLWVKNTTPCQLWFTDDAGTDTRIV